MALRRGLWTWAFLPCGTLGVCVLLFGLFTDNFLSVPAIVVGALLCVGVPLVLRPIARDLDIWAQTPERIAHRHSPSDSKASR
ncbi:MAG TPA: hypothetical protein VFQ88_12760 [Nevskiaceae bacterium]|nr:hypothetical protein [Nevskiaceae bacterium]